VKINSKLIHKALEYVHTSERSARNPDGCPRAVATRHAVKQYGLTAVETEILCNALLVAPEEIK
jgi:hypothetical protein